MTRASRRRARPPRPPRKKACKSCTRSKVRCSLERPACARCDARERECEYVSPTPGSGSRIPDIQRDQDVNDGGPLSTPTTAALNTSLDPSLGGEFFTLPNHDVGALPSTTHTQTWQHISDDRGSKSESELDFTNPDLVPNDRAGNIRDRWLRPYILPALGDDEIPKLYDPFTIQFMSRVLATYPHRMLEDGDCPPIIHHTQVSGDRMPRSLANCYTLVRMWLRAAPGSEAIVVTTVQNEMDRLAMEPATVPDITHLSAFQAYLIYTLLMYFSPPTDLRQPLVTDKTMITLMEMAYRTACHGLILSSELSHTKPTWESWIVASTKRRAIYAMYLFSSVYNADHALPNFIADELTGVLLPEARTLWEARTRQDWTRVYEKYLGKWADGMMDISELWRSEETGSRGRRGRIERWVGTVDEFGMMLFSVCAHLHGC